MKEYKVKEYLAHTQVVGGDGHRGNTGQGAERQKGVYETGEPVSGGHATGISEERLTGIYIS